MQSVLSSQQVQMEAQQAEMHEMRQQIAFLTRMSQQSPTIPQPHPTPQPNATTDQQTLGFVEFMRDRLSESDGTGSSGTGNSGGARGGCTGSQNGDLFGRGNSTIDKLYIQTQKKICTFIYVFLILDFILYFHLYKNSNMRILFLIYNFVNYIFFFN